MRQSLSAETGFTLNHLGAKPLTSRDISKPLTRKRAKVHNTSTCTFSTSERGRVLRKKGSWKNKSSIYRGVSFNRKNQKWKSVLTVKSKQHFLGYFASELEAALMYDRESIKRKGEDAATNFDRATLDEQLRKLYKSKQQLTTSTPTSLKSCNTSCESSSVPCEPSPISSNSSTTSCDSMASDLIGPTSQSSLQPDALVSSTLTTLRVHETLQSNTPVVMENSMAKDQIIDDLAATPFVFPGLSPCDYGDQRDLTPSLMLNEGNANIVNPPQNDCFATKDPQRWIVHENVPCGTQCSNEIKMDLFNIKLPGFESIETTDFVFPNPNPTSFSDVVDGYYDLTDFD